MCESQLDHQNVVSNSRLLGSCSESVDVLEAETGLNSTDDQNQRASKEQEHARPDPK